MNRKRNICLGAFLLVLAARGLASAQEARGRELVERYRLSGIREIPAPVNDLAIASFDQAGPVIYYNPLIVMRAGPAVSAFIRAHEYGHHKLGHLRRAMFASNPYEHLMLTRQNEIEADKFATRYWLRENPQVLQAAIQAFRSSSMSNLGDATHLPTAARAALIEQWMREASNSTDSNNEDRPRTRAQRRAADEDDEPDSSERQSETVPMAQWRRGPCMHRIPCIHVGPFGRLHPFDTVHPFDLYPPGS